MLQVFKNILNYISYIFISVKQNVISSFANKKSFFVQTIMMAINNISWLLVWIVLFYKSGNNINGVTMKDILYLWSLPVIGFGFAFFCFGGVEDLSSNIANGNLDVYLTQPKFSLIGLLTSKCKVSALGDFLYGLILGLFATNFNILSYIFLILISMIGGIMIVCIVSLVHMFTFWIGNISSLATIYTNSLLITFSIYPEKMYKGFSRILIFTLVPAFYCTYLPISICSTFSLLKLLIFLLIAFLFILITIFVYKQGLKRYESGNAFNLR